jgi:Tol biopolymer transport system component
MKKLPLVVGLIGAALLLVACGERARQITEPEASGDTAAVTPNARVQPADGPKRIAFISDVEGAFRLYTMEPDGTDIRRLSDVAVDQSPFSVSRDLTQIAVVGATSSSVGETSPVVYRVDAIDGETMQIAAAPPTGSDVVVPAAEWTEDDTAVLYFNDLVCHAFPTGGGEVRERKADECLEAAVLAEREDGRSAAILGDSLLTGEGSDPNDWRVLDRVIDPSSVEDAGLGALALVALQAYGLWRPVWSPDGETLAYYDGDAGEGRAGLSVIASEGGDPRLLVAADDDADDLVNPSLWSDDGRQVFISGFEEGSTIRVVDVQTGNVRTIVGGDGHTYLHPRWVVMAEPPARAETPFDESDQSERLARELANASGRLIYSGGDSRSRHGYFSARPDGSDEQRLTEDGGYPWSLAANGSRLAYDGRGGIVVVDLKSGERKEFPGNDPTLSRSGGWLAYWTKGGAGSMSLRVVDLISGAEDSLLDVDMDDAVSPGWSFDEQYIAFFDGTFADDKPELMVMGRDGGPPTFVAATTSRLDASPPIAWSPDGTLIAFDDDRARIAAVESGTTQDLPIPASSIAWSPDGRMLAIRDNGIVMYNIETGETRELTNDVSGAVEYPPAWSPDGQWLAYVGADGTLRVLDIETGGIVRLQIEGDEVHWVPD